MPRVSEIFDNFIRQPIVHRSGALFLFKLAQLLHDRSGGAVDDRLRHLLAWFRPPVTLPKSNFLSDSEIAETVDGVRERGWSILGQRLSQEDIADLRAFAFSTPACVGNRKNRISIDPEKPVQDHPRYEWLIGDLLRLPPIRRLMADSALYRVAQDYLQCRPILTSVTMWMDGVFHGKYDAHVYHYDNDGPGFLKFFIYLNDVDRATGAHAFIQGSHPKRKPRQFRAGMRYETDDILNHFGRDNEIVFAAPAGTIIAEDTTGFHRGFDPEKNYRLLMQFQYSIVDIPHAEEFDPGIPRVTIKALDPGIARIARKFARAG